MGMRVLSVVLLLAACSRKIEGPTPVVTGAENERDRSTGPAFLCNAQGDPAAGWLVDALGDKFAPLPTNSLAGTRGLAMPRVELTGPETYTLPEAYVRFVDKTRMPLAMRTADSAADAHALTPGDYTLKVTNLNAASASSPAAAIRVIPPPHITEVSLSSTGGAGATICADQTQTLTVTGTGFRTDKLPEVTIGSHTFTASASTATTVTVTIPAGTFTASETATSGTIYTVKVTNPEGCFAPGAADPVAPAQVTAFPTCTVLGTLSVSPHFGFQLRDTPVTITNQFSTPATQPFSGALPKVFIVAPLAGGGTAQQVPLRSVSFVDQSTVTAVVPVCSGTSFGAPSGTVPADCPGLAVGGPYDILVVDPISGNGSIPGAFTVVSNPPPAITGISPGSIVTTGGAVTVSGANFDATSKVLLGTPVPTGVEFCEVSVTNRTGTTGIAVSVPASLSTGCYIEDNAGNRTTTATGFSLSLPSLANPNAGQYLVRVQHGGDISSADFAALIVTSTSLNPFDKGVSGSTLNTARGQAGAVVAFDDLGQPYLYVAGGSTNGTDGLASVEMAPVGLFNELGGTCSGGACKFHLLKDTPLPTARAGLQLVARSIPATGAGTSYVYAIGGRPSTGGLLNEIWRAQVLRNQDAPTMRQITTAAGPGPGAGTWYYKVAAVFPSGNALNFNGAETLPSDEESVNIDATLRPTIRWGCTAGATSYRVYRLQRSVSSGNVTTTEALLAEPAAACSGTGAGTMTFADTGAAPLDPAKHSLPRGALGAWVSTGKSLNTARFDFQAKTLPVATSDIAVAGGCTAASGPGCGTTDNTVEKIAFAAAADLDPTSVTAVGSGFTARDRFGMGIATTGTANVGAGKTFLLVFGGESGGTEIAGTTQTVLAADIADFVFAAATGAPQNIGVGGWADIVSNQAFSEATRTNNHSLFSKSGSLGAGPFNANTDFNLNLNAGVPPYSVGGTRFLPGEQLFRAFIYVVGGFPSDATSGAPAVYGAPTNTIELFEY